MAAARTRDAWSRTATLMALLANCHRDPKKTRPYRPNQFDPFSRKRQPLTAPLNVLREVFVAGRPPGSGCPGADSGGST